MPFADLDPGAPVQLLLQTAAHQVALPATCQARSGSGLLLALTVNAAQQRLLRAGLVVYLLLASGRVEQARLTQVEPGPTTLVSLEPLAPGTAVADQRRFHRVAVPHWAATVVVRTPQRAAQLQVQVVDLSQGGAGLQSPHPLPADLALRLQLSRGRLHLVLLSLVSWAEPAAGGWLSGVRFVEVPRETQRVLDQLVFQLRWQAASATRDLVRR